MFHVLQLDTHAAFVRRLERHDAASLVGFAFHAPKDLDRVRDDYLASRLPARDHAREREAILARARRMMAQHAIMRPEPPPTGSG